MPTLTVNNVSLRYELSGEASAPVLVLSTSLGAHLEMWDPQVEALRDRFRILRYDMRGHGKSSVPAGPYTLQQLGEDVLALADALRIERFHFCGLSIGGVIGQWLALHAAQRVDRLILANTAAKIGTSQTWEDRIALVQREGLAGLAAGTLQRWFTQDFLATGSPLIAQMQQMLLDDDPAGYAAACAALRDADLREQISAIRCPTLIIAGRHDPVTTVADADLLHSRIPESELVILDAAHISNVQAAEQFSAAMQSFLTGQ